MKTRLLLVFFSLIALAGTLHSQDEIIKEINKNYTNKYLGTPSYNGSTTISIPLASVRTQLYGVNLFIATALQSIKVNQLGTEVGLNWQISAGIPYISREVRDLPDGLYSYVIKHKVCFEDEDDFDEFQDCAYQSSDVFQDYCEADEAGGNCLLKEITENAGYLYTQSRGDINEADLRYYDLKSDIYFFNIGGYSGKFIFDENGNVIHLNKANKFIKIEFDSKINAQYPDFTTDPYDEYNPLLSIGYIDRFAITLPNGTVYSLDIKEFTASTSIKADPIVSNKEFSQGNPAYLPRYSDAGGLNVNVSRWKCLIVRDQDYHILASFNYRREMIFNHSRINQSFIKPYNGYYRATSSSVFTLKAIQKVSYIGIYGLSFQDNCEIIFERNVIRQDLEYPSEFYQDVKSEFDKKAYLLNQITVKRNGLNQKVIQFHYGNFPEYTGAIDPSLDAHKVRYKLDSITTNVFNATGTSETLKPITFKYYEQVLPPRHSPNVDMFGFYNGNTSEESFLPEFYYPATILGNQEDFSLTDGFNFCNSLYLFDKLPDSTYVKANILQQVKYRNGDELHLSFEPHKIRIGSNYYFGGGVRLKESKILNANGIKTQKYNYFPNYAVLCMYPGYWLSVDFKGEVPNRQTKWTISDIYNNSFNLNNKLFYKNIYVEIPNRGVIAYEYEGVWASQESFQLNDGTTIFNRLDNNELDGLFTTEQDIEPIYTRHQYFPILLKSVRVSNETDVFHEIYSTATEYEALHYELIDYSLTSIILKPLKVTSTRIDPNNGNEQNSVIEYVYGVTSMDGVQLFVPRKIITSINETQSREKEIHYAIENRPLTDFYNSNVGFLTPLETKVKDENNILLNHQKLILGNFGNDININLVKEYINEKIVFTKDFDSYYWWGDPHIWNDLINDATITRSIVNGFLDSKTIDYPGSTSYTTTYSNPNAWNQATKVTYPDGSEEFINEFDPLGFVSERQLEGTNGVPRFIKKEATLLEYGAETVEYLEISGEVLPKKTVTSTFAGRNVTTRIDDYGDNGNTKSISTVYDPYGKKLSECSSTSSCVYFEYQPALLPWWHTVQLEGWPRNRRYENYIVDGSEIVRSELGKLNLTILIDEHFSRYSTFTDVYGNVVCTRDYKGQSLTDYRETQYFYDAFNRLVNVKRHDGQTYTYDYIPLLGGGMKTITVNPQGISTYTITNLRGQIIEEKVKSGAVFTYEYTVDGKLEHKKLNGSPIISYTYYQSGKGKLGQVHTKSVNIIGGSQSIDYTYDYDALGRLIETQITRPGGIATIEIQEFDALDNPTEVKNTITYNNTSETFIENFTFDNASRLETHEVVGLFGKDYFLSTNQYRLDDQLKTVSLGHSPMNPDQFLEQISYRYNQYGWLTRINDIGECNTLHLPPIAEQDNELGGDATYFKKGYIEIAYNRSNLIHGKILISMDGLVQSIDGKRNVLLSENAQDTIDFIAYGNVRNQAPLASSLTVQYYDLDTRKFTESSIPTDITYNLRENPDTSHRFNFSGIVGQGLKEYAVATLTRKVVLEIKNQGYKLNNQIVRRIEGELRSFMDRKMFEPYDLYSCDHTHDALFSEQIYYDAGLSELDGESQYNGNISAVKYRILNQTGYSAWGYQYDGYGQLIQARYGEKTYYAEVDGDSPWTKDQYSVNYGYTSQGIGNLETIIRNGKLQNGNYGIVDDLILSYTGGILDAVTENGLEGRGYRISSSGPNTVITGSKGNITSFQGRGILSITYNYLGLPTQILFDDDGDGNDDYTLTCVYDAEGNKIKQTYEYTPVFVPVFDVKTEKKWFAGLEFTNKVDKNGNFYNSVAYYHLYGRVIKQTKTPYSGSPVTSVKAEYVLTDHLGNTRVVFTDMDGNWSISRDMVDGEISSIHHYYPFGLEMEGDWQSYDSELLSYDYGYNGIESLENRQLNLATYRILDPGIGRWYQVDPAAESFYGLSPYVSMGNNPVSFIDPEGDFIFTLAALIAAPFTGGASLSLLPYTIAADLGMWQGGTLANGTMNPFKWDYGSGKTWGYMAGGAIVGVVSGGTANAIATSGQVAANTVALMSGSLINSIGTALYTGGQTDVRISFGFGSFNFTTGEFGYLGKKGNSVIQNIGYGLGALAILSDVLVGSNPGDVQLNTKKSAIGHSSLTNVGETDKYNSIVSVGPDPTGKWIFNPFKFKNGTNQWYNYVDAGDKVWKVVVEGVNLKTIMNYGARLNRGVNYNLYFSSCVSHTARALTLAGVPAIGIHPFILHAQMTLRSVGFRPVLYSYYLYQY